MHIYILKQGMKWKAYWPTNEKLSPSLLCVLQTFTKTGVLDQAAEF